jgi:hypothetical protein
MAQIEKITEGMRGREVSELLDRNFKSLNYDIRDLEQASNGNVEKLQEQLNKRGYVVMKYTNSTSDTRLAVPMELRKPGLTITYNPGAGWIQEQFIGVSVDDADWEEDRYWKSIGGSGFGFWVESDVDFVDKTSAHNAIKENERVIGMYISYRLNGTWTTEQYVGIDTSKDNWENPDNWNILTYNEQIAEIAKQAQESGVQAQAGAEKANQAAVNAQTAADKANQAAGTIADRVFSTDVRIIKAMTEEEYIALGEKDKNTLYIIID